MLKSILNTLKFSLKKGNSKILVQKIRRRIFDNSNNVVSPGILNWLNKNAVDFNKFAENLDPELWEESKAFWHDFKKQAVTKLESLPITLGGPGIYPLLYFIVRYSKPKTVVETGVAAGFSSQAFLKAMSKNGQGKLYSSDYPYFRIKDPEQYIGVLVDAELKNNWELFIKGDSVNLPLIVNDVDQIDIFHYDSDKSYDGRENALEIIKPKMVSNSLILIDDINDNSHFFDTVQNKNITDYSIFKFKDKYIGMIGRL